jgi:hypothetical protein
MDNKELIKRWSNDAKRREYIADYKNTADEVLEQSELELTFYITTLPNENKIIAMEYWSTNYSYLTKEYGEKSIRTKYYYQDKEWFTPDAVSESFLSEKLKNLKMKLQER